MSTTGTRPTDTGPDLPRPAVGPPGSPRVGGTRLTTRSALVWAEAAVLALALGLRMWQLDRNGVGNGFYSAAVRSGSLSGHAAFYAALDPHGFVSVDKPPLALWLDEVVVRIVGISSWSLLLPAAAAGVLSVFVLGRAVRRAAGPAAGLVAAGCLAVTPVAVAVSRSSNPDALLVCCLVLAAYALTRALVAGSTGWLVLAGVMVGLGFETKMLQAFLVLPALGLAWLLTAPGDWRRRTTSLLVATAAMALVSAAWPVAVDSAPAGGRPYVGGSRHDSVAELVVGYNGLGRLTGGHGTRAGSQPKGSGSAGPGGQSGVARLVNRQNGPQVGWLLLPAGAAALAVLLTRWRRRRTDPQRAQLVLWGTWALTHAAVFSLMSGAYHPYYTAALAPALAALLGLGVPVASRLLRRGHRRGLAAGGIALAASAAVDGLLLTRVGWQGWLVPAVAVLALCAAAALRRPTACLVLGLAAVLLAPTAYAAGTTSHALLGSDPLGGPAVDGRGRAVAGRSHQYLPVPGGRLLTYLLDHRTSTYLLAVDGATAAEPWVLATGEPVAALGGFNAADPYPGAKAMARLVGDGSIRYALLDTASTHVWDVWVRRHCRVVPRAAYTSRYGTRPATDALWDCRPA